MSILWLAGCQSPHRFQPALDEAPIKAGDVLLVTSSASTEPFALKWTVDPEGNLHLPYSGAWKVAGKTPAEVAMELSAYFSVRRAVTFKIEKLSAELFPQNIQPPEAPPVLSPPPLESPKVQGTSNNWNSRSFAPNAIAKPHT